jgi:hypothetical protein
MVVKRAIARALEELTAASEFPQRRESFPSELYDLSEFVTRRPSRPELPEESSARDEDKPARIQATVPPDTGARRRPSRRAGVRGMLSTTRGVQQALLLQEIVGPPKALRPWHGEW